MDCTNLSSKNIFYPSFLVRAIVVYSYHRNPIDAAERAICLPERIHSQPRAYAKLPVSASGRRKGPLSILRRSVHKVILFPGLPGF